MVPGAPVQNASVALRLVIPAASTQQQRFARRPRYVSPGSNSLSFSQLNGPTTVVSIAPGASSCTADAGGTRTCTVAVSATAGPNETFTIKTFASSDGTGTPLSVAAIVATIVPLALNTVSATLNGVVSTINVSTAQPRLNYGEAGSTAVIVNAIDATGNTIVGPGVYADASGNPVTITLSVTDPTNSASLTATSATQPGTAIALNYNGGAAASVAVTGTTANLPPVTATVALTCRAPSSQSALYASTRIVDIATETPTAAGVARYATTASGAAPGPVAAITLSPSYYFAALAVDADGLFSAAFSTAAGDLGIGTFCPDATGTAPPYRSFAPQYPLDGHLALDPAHNLYAVDYDASTQGLRVDEYAAGTGDLGYTSETTPVAPIRSIAGPDTGLLASSVALTYPALAVDAAGDTFVGNAGQITVYGPQAHGDAAPSSTITNTAAGLLGALDTAVDAAGNVYVLYFADNRSAVADVTSPYGGYAVAEFTAGGSTTAPSRVISGSATQLGTYFGSSTGHGIAGAFVFPPTMTVDPGGTIYVASRYVDTYAEVEVAEFDQGVSGNSAPSRTIDVNAATGEFGFVPLALAADANHVLYLADGAGFGVLVFDSSGHLARHIPAAVGGVGIVTGVALDAGNDLVLQSLAYTPQQSSTTIGQTAIFVFPPGAGANTPPTRTVTNGNSVPTQQTGRNDRIALDAAGNVYEVTNIIHGPYSPSFHEISVYSTTAANDAPPIATFTDPRLEYDTQRGIALDAQGRVYVTSFDANEVNVYGAGTTSATAVPVQSYADYGGSTIGSGGLRFDSTGGLYASSCDSDSVSFYPAGTTTASRAIAGPHTLLLCPTAIALDSAGSIYVLDDNAVRVFAAGASGDVAPLRSLDVGQALQFSIPSSTNILDIGIGPGTVGTQAQSRAPAAATRASAPTGPAVRARTRTQRPLSASCRAVLAAMQLPLRTSRPQTTPRTEPLRGQLSCR